MGRAATTVVHDDRTVYIPILNEALFFGKLMDHSPININPIRSFGITVSNDLSDRTR